MTFNTTWSITTGQRILETHLYQIKSNSLERLLNHTKVTLECFKEKGIKESYVQAGVDHRLGFSRTGQNL